MTQQCPLISRCLKHAMLVISIFVRCVTFGLLSLLRLPKTIAAAIVGSRLDFCNSLLAGTSVSNLARLQRVQNTLARVDAQKPRFCHITPVFSDLHWLPVRRINRFKIATVTYRVLQFQQPSYLASLIPRYVPAQALRSSSSLSICVPTRKTTMAASKSFLSVASGIWNALPNHLSSAPTLLILSWTPMTVSLLYKRLPELRWFTLLLDFRILSPDPIATAKVPFPIYT